MLEPALKPNISPNILPRKLGQKAQRKAHSLFVLIVCIGFSLHSTATRGYIFHFNHNVAI